VCWLAHGEGQTVGMLFPEDDTRAVDRNLVHRAWLPEHGACRAAAAVARSVCTTVMGQHGDRGRRGIGLGLRCGPPREDHVAVRRVLRARTMIEPQGKKRLGVDGVTVGAAQVSPRAALYGPLEFQRLRLRKVVADLVALGPPGRGKLLLPGERCRHRLAVYGEQRGLRKRPLVHDGLGGVVAGAVDVAAQADDGIPEEKPALARRQHGSRGRQLHRGGAPVVGERAAHEGAAPERRRPSLDPLRGLEVLSLDGGARQAQPVQGGQNVVGCVVSAAEEDPEQAVGLMPGRLPLVVDALGRAGSVGEHPQRREVLLGAMDGVVRLPEVAVAHGGRRGDRAVLDGGPERRSAQFV